VVYDSKDSAQTQFQNAQDAIARKVDGIIICPTDSATCAPVLAEAQKAGIPVVIEDIGTTGGEYVSYIRPLTIRAPSGPAKYWAKKMAEKGWGKGSKVGVVTVSLARINGQLRTKGFRDAHQGGGPRRSGAFAKCRLYHHRRDLPNSPRTCSQRIPTYEDYLSEADEPAMGGPSRDSNLPA